MPNAFDEPISVEITPVLEATQKSTKPLLTNLRRCNYNIDDFNDMIDSITRALEFFQLYLTELVVDAAVGTRILQGTSVFLISSQIQRCQAFSF